MKYALAALCILLPFSAHAAGFAKNSLFLSKSSVTEGETVLIHAVVSNEASSPFSGSLIFSNDTGTIGSAPVSLGAGEAQTASVSWKPVSGTHAVTATLRSSAGELSETQKATFSVRAKPTPVAETQSAAVVESSEAIQTQLESFSPAAANASAPVFTLVDGGRARVVDVLDTQIEQTKSKLDTQQSSGEVSGAQTEKLPDTVGGLWFALYTLYLYLLTILRFLISNAGVFYPLLAVAFLYGLWRLYKSFRR